MKIKNKIWFGGVGILILALFVLWTLVVKDGDFIAADTFNATDFFTGEDDCMRKYERCIDASRSLPGSVYDAYRSSPFTIAWSDCTEASNACETAKRAKKEEVAVPPSAPAPTSVPAPTPASTSVPTPSPSDVASKKPLNVSIAAIKGEVEYRRAGGSKDMPLTKGVELKEGDTIITGEKGIVTLTLGNQTLNVYQWTHFRVDESLRGDNVKKTKLYLEIGAIEGKVKHTAAIRSDFSVATPNANASIRGSAMTVQYDKEKGVTNVYVTEDSAVVRGTGAGIERTVKKGNMVTVGPDGKVGKPVKFKQADLTAVRKGKKS